MAVRLNKKGELEFDTVAEAVEYKKLINGKAEDNDNSKEPKPKKEKTFVPYKKKIKINNKRRSVTKKEKVAVRTEMMKSKTKERYLSSESLERLSKNLNRSKQSISLIAHEIRKGLKENVTSIRYTNEIYDAVKKIIEKKPKGAQLKSKDIDKIVKKFGMTRGGVYGVTYRVRKELGLLNEKKSKAMQNKPYLTRKKAKIPIPIDVQRQNLANEAIAKAKKKKVKQITAEELEFPTIYPISEESVPLFEAALVNMIGNKSKISYLDIQRSFISLANGKEWTGRDWKIFCDQFLLQKNKIAKALNCDAKKLKVVIEGGYHYITYK